MSSNLQETSNGTSVWPVLVLRKHAGLQTREYPGTPLLLPAPSDLLPPGTPLAPGAYRLRFQIGEYASRCHAEHPSTFAAEPFFPDAQVTFSVVPSQVRSALLTYQDNENGHANVPRFAHSLLQTQSHFHVPLTWSPFAYSTYRGS